MVKITGSEKMIRKSGIMIFLLGLLLFIGAVTYPIVIVVADTSAPVINTTDIAPRNGRTYSNPTITDWAFVYCSDPESGIATIRPVRIEIDNIWYDMKYQQTIYGEELWSFDGTTTTLTLSSGSHAFKFRVENGNGYITFYSGTFTIYTDLQGDWYINNVKVTSPDQVIRLTTLEITAKFIKTLGVEDSAIFCELSYTGPTSGQWDIPHISANTWETTFTLSQGGTYTMTLTATDPYKSIVMTIAGVEIPGGLPYFDMGLVLRVFLVIVGLGMMFYPVYNKRKR